MAPAEATHFPISEISTYQPRGWTIKARVSNKAPIRTFSKGTNGGKVFHVELLDASGGEIRASFFNTAVDQFYDKLVVGKCFTLSKGNVKVANRQYNNCNHRYELVFDKDAVVEAAEDDAAIQTVRYNFVNLRALESRTGNRIVDLCCVITAFQPLQTIKKDGQELVKRELTLADDTASTLTVAIWNERAKQPDSKFEGSPIVALKGVNVKEWNGGLAGSLTASGSIDFNPSLPEAERLQQWWTKGGSSQNLTALSKSGGGGGLAAQNAKDATLAEIRTASQQLSSEQMTFNVVSRLALVQLRKQGETQPLSYMACQEPREGQSLPCQRRLDDRGFCATCNKAGKAAARMNIRCRYSDFADQTWLTTFSEAAEKVLGVTAQQVRDMESTGAREKLEGAIREQYFTQPFQLLLRAKLDSYMGETRTNVTCISAQPVNIRQHGRKMLKEIREHLVAVAA
eukprot:CAMPEP_0178434068 /NCGR_PEP_ID=MMETSP0689_2-20121128/33233_1 /TAXON_ID=160604 /ORGANISM="Amphidinium massartii, Strain CS-259" /LENGTH=456 /DNA_ID=CAMNT_0020056121 /DNA_START=146 /DNA_END=1516 /DNA_ORIENTATION=-